MKNKILIVDDERTVIQQVDTLLEQFGYESDFIPKADLLFKKLDNSTFDLILMDINMPGIDGITALKNLKANPHYTDIPVIMMTGDTNEQTLELCFTTGAADFITKPIQELVLRARVKSVIEKQNYIKRIKKQNHDIFRSIDYARTIQEAMLPQMSYMQSLFPESFIFFKPRDIVSGDFYWFAKQGNKTFAAVVDCTGHGVPVAFMSMLGISNLNHIINVHQIYEPDLILAELHQDIREALKQSESSNRDGMDITIFALEGDTLEFAGAHNEMLICKDGKAEIIHGDRTAIGGRQLKDNVRTFTKQTVQLEKGTSIYMYSDGFADQFGGPNTRKFNKERLRDFLLKISGTEVQKQCQLLDNELTRWQGDQRQIDDILVFGMKY